MEGDTIVVGAPFYESWRQVIGCLLLFFLAWLFRAPMVAYSVTVFDLKTGWGQWLFTRLFNRLRLIAVRERTGWEVLGRLGVTTDIRLIEDARAALHAATLALTPPWSDAPLSLEAPIPVDLENLLARLSRER